MTKKTKTRTSKPRPRSVDARIPVVIYTARSIYFGRVADPCQRPILEVHGFRHVYYCDVTEGNHSLQVHGPGPNAKITPACTEPYFLDARESAEDGIRGVGVCSASAVAAFDRAGWARWAR